MTKTDGYEDVCWTPELHNKRKQSIIKQQPPSLSLPPHTPALSQHTYTHARSYLDVRFELSAADRTFTGLSLPRLITRSDTSKE